MFWLDFFKKKIRNKRAKPIMIDPALYSLNKSEIIWASSERTIPTAFKLYTGSFFLPSLFQFLWRAFISWLTSIHADIYAKSMAILVYMIMSAVIQSFANSMCCIQTTDQVDHEVTGSPLIRWALMMKDGWLEKVHIGKDSISSEVPTSISVHIRVQTELPMEWRMRTSFS